MLLHVGEHYMRGILLAIMRLLIARRSHDNLWLVKLSRGPPDSEILNSWQYAFPGRPIKIPDYLIFPPSCMRKAKAAGQATSGAQRSIFLWGVYLVPVRVALS